MPSLHSEPWFMNSGHLKFYYNRLGEETAKSQYWIETRNVIQTHLKQVLIQHVASEPAVCSLWE